jgi:hypothetical protein
MNVPQKHVRPGDDGLSCFRGLLGGKVFSSVNEGRESMAPNPKSES